MIKKVNGLPVFDKHDCMLILRNGIKETYHVALFSSFEEQDPLKVFILSNLPTGHVNNVSLKIHGFVDPPQPSFNLAVDLANKFVHNTLGPNNIPDNIYLQKAFEWDESDVVLCIPDWIKLQRSFDDIMAFTILKGET